jgi:2-haloacid dehalogenase
MVNRPDLVLLDVNETLSDLGGMQDAFAEVGLPPGDTSAWFAGVLRDGFALTVLGDNPAFADLAGSSLRVRLADAGHPDPAGAAQQVLERFSRLVPHPDVVPGLLGLHDAGCRIATLSNGSAAVAESLLGGTEAGVVVECYLSVQDAGAWKPASRAYAYALDELSVPPDRAMLVAVHPWDLEGGHRAGLRTAWIRRGSSAYPDGFTPPDVEAEDFVELASMLGS